MTPVWAVYAVLVGALLGGAARLTESVTERGGLAGRWSWAAALAGSLLVPVWWAAFATAPGTPAGRGASILAAASDPAAAGAAAWWADGWARADAAARAVGILLDPLEPWLLGAWGTATALLAAALIGGLGRLGARARGWERRRVAGVDALVSPDFGPAVLGAFRPRVVVPRRFLALAPERVRAVVLHEDEHRRARDPLLLLAGSVAVTLAPWNPALWWQLRRLRDAVELDCDRRVLRRGVATGAYGQLLLEAGVNAAEARAAGTPLAVASLLRSPSSLERRLTMIVRTPPRLRRGPAVATLAAAALLVALACETPAPTAAPAGAPPGVAADRSGPSGPAGAPGASARTEPRPLRAGEADPARRLVFFVDGKRTVDLKALGIAPADIDRIEVLKGRAAETRYGPDAADGAIHIFTKAGAPGRGAGT